MFGQGGYPASACSWNLPPQGSPRAQPPFSLNCGISWFFGAVWILKIAGFAGFSLSLFLPLFQNLSSASISKLTIVVLFGCLPPFFCCCRFWLLVSFLLVKPILISSAFFSGLLISYARLVPSFLFGCLQRLNNSPNCPNSLVATKFTLCSRGLRSRPIGTHAATVNQSQRRRRRNWPITALDATYQLKLLVSRSNWFSARGKWMFSYPHWNLPNSCAIPLHAQRGAKAIHGWNQGKLFIPKILNLESKSFQT